MSTAVAAVQSIHRSVPVMTRAAKPGYIAQCATACSTCAMRRLCLPDGITREQLAFCDELVSTRKRIKRGEHVFRANDKFTGLYAFRTGFFKGYVESEDGRMQVTTFQMAGDIAGLDGIDTERHRLNVVALEDGEVCLIPYARLDALCDRMPIMQHHLRRLMSSEIVREQSLMMLLGTMRAESRVASFLLSLSQRFAARGYSAIEFNLRMTREEIGSYLGLKLETVSRIFSRLQEEGLIQVQGRALKLLDVQALTELAGQREARGVARPPADDLYRVQQDRGSEHAATAL